MLIWGRSRSSARQLCALLVVGCACGLIAPSAADADWSPGSARYGVALESDLRVTMDDGTILTADVYRPTDPQSGQPAPGPFPVLLVQTPYGKRSTSFIEPIVPKTAGGVLAASGPSRYLIERGYMTVVADVRGTGGSQGTWGLFDPVQAQDGASLVQWAAKLPHSSGAVGLYGASYLGINQFLTAGQLGPGSPLKAIVPVIAGSELYRDTAFPGGIPGAEFALPYLGLTGALNVINPAFTNPQPGDAALAVLQHIAGFANFQVPFITTAVLGGDQVYDEQYWRARAPVHQLERIARNRVPALMIGGWYDLFGRGTPLNYSGLQNAAAGRPVDAPMRPDQPVTPRYQLVMGPWYHLTAGKGIDLERLLLQWFDRWLKGARTGIDQTRSPMRLYVLGAKRWIDAAHLPFAKATPTTWYLRGGRSGSGAPSPNDGRLTTEPPDAPGATDQLIWSALTSFCNGGTEVWSAGAFTAFLTAQQSEPNPTANPCALDDRQRQLGPGALTYTTAPFQRPTLIAGPIGATIYATSTRPDVQLIATLEDVAPGGVSTPVTSGVLLGSLRALDRERSWLTADGKPLLPYHPYTRASKEQVAAGKVTRFDIEIFSTLAQLAAGHRLRLTLNSSETPRMIPTAPQGADLLGGVYRVQRTPAAPSSLTIPMAAPDALDTPGALPRCRGKRRFAITIRVPRRAGRIVATIVRYAGRRAKVTGRGRTRRAVIDLRRLGSATVRVRIVARTASGRTYRFTRTYHPCRKRAGG